MNAKPLPSTVSSHVSHPVTLPHDFRTLLLDSLHERWRTFRAELKRCQKKPSEEAVHDLRVAMRRLISMLDLLASIYPEGNLWKARRRLKKQLNKFGPLRDAQVQVLSIENMLPSFPELHEFYAYLVKREGKLVQRLDVEVKRVKTGKVKRAIGAATQQIQRLLDTPAKQRKRRTAAIRTVDTAFNTVVQRKLAINPSDSAAIHRMRVAFKKFRYMVESLAPMLDGVTRKRLKAMNAFQSSMGDIQDAEVLLTHATAFARKRGRESETPLARALEELARRRTMLCESFLKSADTLFTFWQPMSSRRRLDAVPEPVKGRTRARAGLSRDGRGS
jgi:CHAD domain-containing protein